jgi:hypothetical protein
VASLRRPVGCRCIGRLFLICSWAAATYALLYKTHAAETAVKLKASIAAVRAVDNATLHHWRSDVNYLNHYCVTYYRCFYRLHPCYTDHTKTTLHTFRNKDLTQKVLPKVSTNNTILEERIISSIKIAYWVQQEQCSYKVSWQ